MSKVTTIVKQKNKKKRERERENGQPYTTSLKWPLFARSNESIGKGDPFPAEIP